MWVNVLPTVLHLSWQILGFFNKYQRVNQALGDVVTEFCFHNLVCKCILHLQIVRSGLDLALKISVMVKYLSLQIETNCSAVNGEEYFKTFFFLFGWYFLLIKSVWCLPGEMLCRGYILKWSGNRILRLFMKC